MTPTLSKMIADLRAKLEKAINPSDWTTWPEEQRYTGLVRVGWADEGKFHEVCEFNVDRNDKEHADLVAAACSRLPALLDAAERAEGEKAKLHEERDAAIQRSLESQILAHKWMVAHDALAASGKYECPKPADLPEAIARAHHAEAENAKLREALAACRTTAVLLLQNAKGCAANHYGEDFAMHGLPGWLADAERDIAAVAEALKGATA